MIRIWKHLLVPLFITIIFTKKNTPNPLNIYDCRKFGKKPHGLEFLQLDYTMFDQSLEGIEKWILENLKGRYYVGKHLAVDNQNRIRNFILVGFENPKELSLFNLSCPYIHR